MNGRSLSFMIETISSRAKKREKYISSERGRYSSSSFRMLMQNATPIILPADFNNNDDQDLGHVAVQLNNDSTKS